MKKILGRVLIVVPAIALQMFWYALILGGLDTVLGGYLGNIIQRGVFWDTLTEILTDRVAAGVDVRVMYDDVGSIATYSVADIISFLKSDYETSLEQCRQRSLADINNGIFNRLFDCGLRVIAPLL